MQYTEFKRKNILVLANKIKDLTLEDFKDILLESFNFNIDGADLEEGIESNVGVNLLEEDYKIDYLDEKITVYRTDKVIPWVYLVSEEGWEKIVKDAGYEYVGVLDDLISDYFDFDQFFKDLFEDEKMCKEVLKAKDITDFEVTKFKDETVVIFKD